MVQKLIPESAATFNSKLVTALCSSRSLARSSIFLINMVTFTQADESYRFAIEAQGRELITAFTAAHSVSSIDLSGNDLTHAVLLRLKSFYLSQERIKSGLSKNYAASGADFFVEAVCFFLKVVLAKLDPSLTVHSERSLARKQGSMRPDISVWREDEVIAAIECKTQLGWNRDRWRHDFEDRERQLAAEQPVARLFLLVMTGANWPGFGSDQRVGKQFFLLLDKIWPSKFDVSAHDRVIMHSIEKLFIEVLLHAKR